MKSPSKPFIAGAMLAVGYWAGWAYPAGAHRCLSAVLFQARFPHSLWTKNRT